VKLYIAGPIKGIENHNREHFTYADKALRAYGFGVVNPKDIPACEDMKCGGDPQYVHTWECWLKYDLREMLLCDGVALLFGWQLSRGASLEVRVADEVGIPVKMFWLWMDGFVPESEFRMLPRRKKNDHQQPVQAVQDLAGEAQHGEGTGGGTEEGGEKGHDGKICRADSFVGPFHCHSRECPVEDCPKLSRLCPDRRPSPAV